MPEDINPNELPGTLKVVAALVTDESNQRVLLVKHKDKAWNKTDSYGLPAGHIKPGESPQEAAVRELKEETGLIATPEKFKSYPNNYFSQYIERHTPPEPFLKHASMTVYKCSGFEGELTESDETSPEWVEISKLGELELMPNVSLAINNYFNSQHE